MYNKCIIYSLIVATLFQNEIQFSSNTIMERLKRRDSDSFCGCNMSCFYQVFASYYSHDRSLLMSRCNVIFYLFLLLTYLSRWAPNARCLVADDAFTSCPVCSRVSSTMLLISGANVYVASWKRVAVTSNICCNIATGTCLISAG